MATLTPSPKMQFFTANGVPLSGGKLYTFSAGTTTPLATYTDSTGSVPNTNPVILDARGEASVWLGSSAYYMELHDSLGTLIWSADNVAGMATLATLAASGGSALVGFIQAGTGAVARTSQAKMREVFSVTDFGAVGNGVTDDTAAVNAWIAAIPSGGMGYVPPGSYVVDPITINKSIFLKGESTRSGTIASRFIARGNQSHILKFAGVGFPNILFGWGIEDISIFGGTAYTISDCALLIQDAGMCNLKDVVITNVTGTAIRFKNAQDIHFLRPVIADCGNNAGAKPVIYYDPTSSNNCNNIYWIDPHFESMAYSIMVGSGATDDQIQIIGGKNENRNICNGITTTNFAFPLFDVACGRFSCHNLTMTNTHLFSQPTFKLYRTVPQVTGVQVQNSSAQTGDFVSIDAACSGYIVKNNGGYNISQTNGNSGISNISAKHGDVEPVWWANNSITTNRRAILDSVSPPIERMTANAGGDYIYGSAGSLLGKSLSFSTVSDAVAGVKLPIGYPQTIRVYWRVKATAAITVSLGVRTAASVYTAITTGVSVGTSFTVISMGLTSGQLATAYEAVLLKETAGTDSVIVDGCWFEYNTEWITFTPSWTAESGTAPAIGNGTLTGRYVRHGDLINCQIALLAGSTTTFGNGGVLRFGLPINASPLIGASLGNGFAYIDDTGAGWTVGFPIIRAATYCDISLAVPGTIGSGRVTNAAPMTWATGDSLFITLAYKSV